MMQKKSLFLSVLISLIFIGYIVTPSATLFQLGLSAERSIAGLTVKNIALSEGDLVYLEGGKGPTLLLVHGFGGNKDNWTRLARHLTSNYHVIAIDLPAFGDSFKHMHLDYDLSAQVVRLNEFVNRLELNSFHLAGNSMGGYIAGNYAANFADNILTLWLLNPLGVAQAPPSEMFTMIRENKRPVVLVKTKSEYQQLLAYVFHQRPYIPDFFITELAKQAQRNFPLHEKIFNHNHQMSKLKVEFLSPLDDVLSSFSRPVLITWGDQDRILHPDGAHRLVAVIPDATLGMMANVGHLPMIEVPAATAKQFMLFEQNRR
jgi:pimeloyl-ACP methyl ester carboxylesterase